MTIVTLPFATSVVWLVVEAKRYSDLFAMYFLLIHIQEKVRLSEAVTAWLITAGHESERHHFIEDISV